MLQDQAFSFFYCKILYFLVFFAILNLSVENLKSVIMIIMNSVMNSIIIIMMMMIMMIMIMPIVIVIFIDLIISFNFLSCFLLCLI